MADMTHKSKKIGNIIAAAVLTTALATPMFFQAGQRAFAADYSNDYGKDELLEEMENLNLQIAEEGIVLLKNRNNALPFARNDRHVTVFHSCWDPWSKEKYAGNVVGNMEIGCSGNGGSGGVLPSDPRDVYEGLDENGFDVNVAVKNLYERYKVDYNYVNKKGSTYLYDEKYINTVNGPNLKLLKKAEKSFYNFSDAAIITISRQEGEGTDIIGDHVFFDEKEQKKNGVNHYLELNSGEKELIAYAKENFKKVIVVINTGMQMELGELEDDEGIDAILWSGIAGENGLKAIGGVLSGAVNPSGRLPDTWAADFTKDPTYVNFGKGTHLPEVAESENVGQGQYSGNASINGGGYGMYGVDYAEGIYVGYRFYETADTIGYFDGNGGYYNRTNGVVYPFGYGLSYTKFKQEIVAGSFKTAGETISLSVKVTNIGEAAGKEVVQLYYNPPYTAGGIEKASANLIAFAKTDVLKPNGEQIITLSFDKREMASYDYNDANEDGHKGYELEKGDYILSVGKNSHETWKSVTYSHKAKTDYDTDEKTGKTIEQLFSGEGNIYNLDRREFTEDGSGVEYMHRSIAATETEPEKKNGFAETFPQIRLGQAMNTEPNGGRPAYPDGYAYLKPQYPEIFFYSLRGGNPVNIADDYEKRYEEYGLVYDWLRTEADCAGWTQAASRAEGEKTAIQLKEMIGIAMDDAVLTEEITPLAAEGQVFAGKTGKQAWDLFMNQLTYDELATLVTNAYFQTAAVDSIGKPVTDDNDGPAQLRNHDDSAYSYGFASACTMAATWNIELNEKFGKLMGEWALQNGMTGWYGPSMNIHRSPFCGRNYEYYSEDPVLSGFLGSAAVKGAHSKGLITYIKHFAMNNQETDRANVIVWSDEQTMREIYLKSFEKSIKESDSLGIMLSMNNLGLFQAASNYNFSVKLLREEWGYEGIVISDYSSGKGVQYNLRCQVIPLASGVSTVAASWDAEKGYPVYEGKAAYTEWYAARKTSQYLLYTMCKSNAIKTKADLSVFVPEGETIELNMYQGQNNVYIPMSKDGISKVYKDFTLKNITFPDQSNFDSRTDGKTNLFFSGYRVNKNGFLAFNDELGFTAPGVTEFVMTGITEDGTEVVRNLKVSVLPPVQLNNMHAVVGQPFQAKTVLMDIEGIAIDEIWDVSVYDTDIPGIKIDDEGNVTGTPTKAGTYYINFLMNDEYYVTNLPLEVHEEGWAPTPEFRVNGGILQYRIMEGLWQDIGVVASVEKTATEGLKDTYTVTFSNGESFTYTVTNGSNGKDGVDGANGTNGVDGAPGKDGADGADGTNGVDGAPGKDGEDGKGIVSAVINEKGELVLTYTDGTEANMGVVKGADGKDGVDGKDGADAKGCGSAIDTAAPVAAASVLILAGIAVSIAVRRRKNG